MLKSMKVLALTVVVVTAFSVACSGTSRRGSSRFNQKLIILGFDGMDPHLLGKWMAEGKLPNISKLAKGGGMFPLQTTHSPESPTAWASFATGVNAGKHNIYDFLVRDTTSYLPDLGMVTRTPPKFLFNYFPISKPKLTSIRGGTSFWVTAQGRRALRHPDRARDLSARRGHERPDALGSSASRHPRDDGHLLLLRDRSQPLRRGEYRDGRHPEAARLRRRSPEELKDRRARSLQWIEASAAAVRPERERP
jgi:hypothetical protein